MVFVATCKLISRLTVTETTTHLNGRVFVGVPLHTTGITIAAVHMTGIVLGGECTRGGPRHLQLDSKCIVAHKNT